MTQKLNYRATVIEGLTRFQYCPICRDYFVFTSDTKLWIGGLTAEMAKKTTRYTEQT